MGAHYWDPGVAGSYDGRRKALKQALMEKTRELGREVMFAEMAQDMAKPAPNDYAFYWGSFGAAAEICWAELKRMQAKEGEMTMDADKKRILEFYVDDYVRKGEMPSERALRKNNFVKFDDAARMFGGVPGLINAIQAEVNRQIAEGKIDPEKLKVGKKRKRKGPAPKTRSVLKDAAASEDAATTEDVSAPEETATPEETAGSEDVVASEEPAAPEEAAAPEAVTPNKRRRVLWSEERVEQAFLDWHSEYGEWPKQIYLGTQFKMPSIGTVSRYGGMMAIISKLEAQLEEEEAEERAAMEETATEELSAGVEISINVEIKIPGVEEPVEFAMTVTPKTT